MKFMKANVGIADSGIAIAEIAVERHSRRKKKTTTTARMEPSISVSIDERKPRLVSSTVVNTWVIDTSGFVLRISASFASMPFRVVTSEKPLAL